MIRKNRIIRILLVLAIATGVGWFSFTSWKFTGVTWMFSPPESMFLQDERFDMTEDSPVDSLADHECIRFDSIPITRKPICEFQRKMGDERWDVAIEWGPGEYYKYYSRGPAYFWYPTTW
ncbi:hypothetical protein [Nocardia sp. CNY236]|uniref:hypothetical protein n=1 Tax=Nocardia sp. CNY236 TaxID=1169152 RepID=UPI00049149EE|nr:hypothetical protein [Nocardia sp. CNY236]